MVTLFSPQPQAEDKYYTYQEADQVFYRIGRNNREAVGSYEEDNQGAERRLQEDSNLHETHSGAEAAGAVEALSFCNHRSHEPTAQGAEDSHGTLWKATEVVYSHAQVGVEDTHSHIGHL